MWEILFLYSGSALYLSAFCDPAYSSRDEINPNASDNIAVNNINEGSRRLEVCGPIFKW